MTKGENLNIAKLMDAIAAQPAPPCDGCDHSARCSAEQLACTDFETYVDKGFRVMTFREPTRARFDAIHGEHSDRFRLCKVMPSEEMVIHSMLNQPALAQVWL